MIANRRSIFNNCSCKKFIPALSKYDILLKEMKSVLYLGCSVKCNITNPYQTDNDIDAQYQNFNWHNFQMNNGNNNNQEGNNDKKSSSSSKEKVNKKKWN